MFCSRCLAWNDVVEAVLRGACKGTSLIGYRNKATTGFSGAYTPQAYEGWAANAVMTGLQVL